MGKSKKAVERHVKPLVGLPVEFRGCMWNDGWEFDAPSVIYYPSKFVRYGDGGNSGVLDRLVEDICFDLAEGNPTNDAGLAKECEWRGWGKRFDRRKEAWHVVFKVRWFREKNGAIGYEVTSRKEVWGLPNPSIDARQASQPQKRGKTMTSDELDAVASNALLAFPIRHHYECQADCKLCLDDHMRLADFLYEVGGIPRSRVDALGDYRRWLDRHKIYAEGADGWGTRNFFDAANIKAYLREEWDCAAFDDANDQAQAAPLAASSLERLVGQED